MTLSEADFQRWFIEAARLGGWKVCHFRPGKTQRGNWVTPIQGDKGCPDLILAKAGRVLLVELKTDKGTPSKEQVAWLEAAGGHGRLWRPENREAILLDLGLMKARPLSSVARLARLQDLAADAASGGDQ